MESVRIDKYLWAIRAFKTRSDAADACNGNKVRLNGTPAKAAKQVKLGDLLEVRKAAVLYTYKVLRLTESRMGAALVGDFVSDLTPESERAKLQAPKEMLVFQRDRGSGRPSKKERRQLDGLRNAIDFDD